MAFTNATKEAAALAVTGLGNWISLHTADPATTGTGEATGGSPAYARKQTTWSGGAADGSVPGSAVAFWYVHPYRCVDGSHRRDFRGRVRPVVLDGRPAGSGRCERHPHGLGRLMRDVGAGTPRPHMGEEMP